MPGTVTSTTPPGASILCSVWTTAVDVVDELHCLGDDGAIERGRWNPVSFGQVADDRNRRRRDRRMQHVAAGDVITAVTAGHVGIADFEHPPTDGLRLSRHELIDIETIDGRTTIEAPVVADRLRRRRSPKSTLPTRGR